MIVKLKPENKVCLVALITKEFQKTPAIYQILGGADSAEYEQEKSNNEITKKHIIFINHF